MTDPAPLTPAPMNWAPAEAAAAKHRTRRLQDDPRSRQRSHRLGVAAIVLWAISLTLTIAGLAMPGLVGDVLALIGDAVLFGYAAVAFLWSNSSGRYMLRGSASSIRSALPAGTWPAVRRQLHGRSRPDPEHHAVIVELAHQQRRLSEGMIAFAGFYVVLHVGIAHSNSGWLRYGVLLFGAVLLIWAITAGIAGYRRLGRLTETDTSGTYTTSQATAATRGHASSINGDEQTADE